MAIRILVTGSRHHRNKVLIRRTLAQVWADLGGDPDVTLVHGEADGADKLSEEVANEFGWEIDGHEAEWDRYKKAAGGIRNQKMVDRGADFCAAFPLPGSKGTWDCVRRAEAAGIRYEVYE